MYFSIGQNQVTKYPHPAEQHKLQSGLIMFSLVIFTLFFLKSVYPVGEQII